MYMPSVSVVHQNCFPLFNILHILVLSLCNIFVSNFTSQKTKLVVPNCFFSFAKVSLKGRLICVRGCHLNLYQHQQIDLSENGIIIVLSPGLVPPALDCEAVGRDKCKFGTSHIWQHFWHIDIDSFEVLSTASYCYRQLRCDIGR